MEKVLSISQEEFLANPLSAIEKIGRSAELRITRDGEVVATMSEFNRLPKHAPNEQWGDELERNVAYGDLFAGATSDFQKFMDNVIGHLRTATRRASGNGPGDERFIVMRAPYYSNEDEASTPFDAVRNAVEFELDGGSSWHVWDRYTGVGYFIRPNKYIYQPLEEAVSEMAEAACMANSNPPSESDPDPDKRFWIDASPHENPFSEFGEGAVGVVDEHLGGIFAYFSNLDIANEYCSKLNADHES